MSSTATVHKGLDPDRFDVEVADARLARLRATVRPGRRPSGADGPAPATSLPLPLGDVPAPVRRRAPDALRTRLHGEVHRLLRGDALARIDGLRICALDVRLGQSTRCRTYGLTLAAGRPQEAPAGAVVTGLLVMPPGLVVDPRAADLTELPDGAVLVAIGPVTGPQRDSAVAAGWPASDPLTPVVLLGTRGDPGPPTLAALRLATVATAATADLLALDKVPEPDAPVAGTIDLPGGGASYELFDLTRAMASLDDGDVVEIDLGPVGEPAVPRPARRRRR
jgi:hypothetical protein